MDVKRFSELFDRLAANVNTVIHGKEDVVRLALVAICSNGHVVFEDVPGVGKSLLARALGASMKADVGRVQCTPDMLPGDITGSSIVDMSKRSMDFVFREGPIFTNILLVDEINRATPKTQSALLEAMQERNVTLDGTTHKLPTPFLILATQNPVEQAGTFQLPEAQLDRFLVKLSVGYPDREAEGQLLDANASTEAITRLGPVSSTEEILAMQQFCHDVELPEPVKMYIVDVCQATRTDPSLLMGASSRASIALVKAARVRAASQGRSVVLPDDVRALLGAVIEHRLILTPDAQLRDETVSAVLERILTRIPVPLGIEDSGRSLSAKTLHKVK